MKRLLIGLMVIGIAAPTAWGLYATRAPRPSVADPAARPALENLPLLRELRQLNDYGIELKARIMAHVYREEREAKARNLKRCLRDIGAGLVVTHTTLRKEGLQDVVGEVVSTAVRPIARARLRLNLYDAEGAPLGATETVVEDLRQGTARPFRASMARLPVERVSKVLVQYLPADAPSGRVPQPAFRSPCGAPDAAPARGA